MRPPYDQWAAQAEANHARAEPWSFSVAGEPGAEIRRQAREETLRLAADFSTRLGVPIRPLGAADGLIVMTGHQPEIYHPGVWVKDFLLQRLAEETGASAVDVVVDSDGFDHVAITSPCLTPEVRRCRQYLAVGSTGSCYSGTAVPSAKAVDDFCRIGDEMLGTLPAPSIRRHFSEFCVHLHASRDSAENLAELVTFARRRYEASAGTDYAELPVSVLSRGGAFSAFVADIALDAERFAEDYNGELDEYRAATRTRSVAQPFPNLGTEDGRVELPLWVLGEGRRETVWVRRDGESLTFMSDSATILEVPAHDAVAAAQAVRSSGIAFAPKALMLTLFLRVFCCDLFIHGVGGGRYDRVTDGVCRRYYGIEPPSFTVASLTMYLPLGAHIVTEDEVAAARERLNRMEHNPDGLMADAEFDSEVEREKARRLSAEKRDLVGAIAEPGADKKSLGSRIRQVNEELGELLEPLRVALTADLAALEAQRAAADVFTDRTYPFCFWSPEEIADKVR